MSSDDEYYVVNNEEIQQQEFKMIPEDKLSLQAATEAYYRFREKIVPFVKKFTKDKGCCDYHTAKPLSEKKPRKVGYLFCGASKTPLDVDLTKEIPIKLYGYHTYGGYYAFFRPDIIEVMWLIIDEIDEATLAAANKIYVTTEAYPNLNVNKCYDRIRDRHMAETIVYLM